MIKLKIFLKKITTLILLVTFLITLTACEKARTPLNNAIAIGYRNNQIYLINNLNQTLLLDGYDLIQEHLSDYMYVRKNNLYGYINREGIEVVKPIYQEAYPMNENKAVVKFRNTLFIIDQNGNTLFTFPSQISYEDDNGITKSLSVNLSCTSYFSCNRLVISENGKYGYLTFKDSDEDDDKDNSNFILPSVIKNDAGTYQLNLPYDYADVYNDNMAVVGKQTIIETADGLNKVEMSYDYINLNNRLLHGNYPYESADRFVDGLAKVGNYMNVEIEGTSSTGQPINGTRSDYILVYNYIRPNGTILADPYDSTPVVAHFGLEPSDDTIVTAVFKYRNSAPIDNSYYKSYTFFNTNGEVIYENCFTYTATENINIFRPTSLISLGGRHVFGFAKQSVSWRLYVADEKYDVFLDILITIEDSETWVDEIANENFINKNMVLTSARVPFYMSNLKKIEFSEEPFVIGIAQVNIVDKGQYGIFQITYDENIDNDESDITDGYTAQYIVPPIYDRIVY